MGTEARLFGMGLISSLLIAGLALGITVLVKYLFFSGKRGGKTLIGTRRILLVALSVENINGSWTHTGQHELGPA